MHALSSSIRGSPLKDVLKDDLRGRLVEHRVDGLKLRVGLGVQVGLRNVARPEKESLLRRDGEENEETGRR